MSVLVTDAHLKQALAVTQSLGRRGIEVYCLSSDRNSAAFHSKYCKRYFVSPLPRDKEQYINFILKIIKETKFDLLITCDDVTTGYISEIQDNIFRYTKVVLPDHKIIQTVLNKDKMMQFAQEKGFPIPKTIYLRNQDDIFNLNGMISYPVVIKATRGAGGRLIRCASSKEELIQKYREIMQLQDNSGLPIIQEYVVGSHYDFYALCDKGEVFAFFIFKTLRAFPITGGTPSKAISVYENKLKNLASKILKELNWHGITNMDFIYDPKIDEFKLLEINPRFGGTTQLAIACGVDFPYFLFKWVILGEKQYVFNYQKDVIYRSLFSEELLHIFQRPRSIPKILLDFLDFKIHYGFLINDLKPVINMIKDTKWKIEDLFIEKHNKRIEK